MYQQISEPLHLIFLHGKPAVGKDSQADFLLENIPNSHKISGLYRSAITRKGEFADFHEDLKPYVLPLGEGLKVPGQLVAKILDYAVENGKKRGQNTFIFCGVLRTKDHLKAVSEWIDELEKDNEVDINHVYYEASDETCLIRAGERFNKSKNRDAQRPDDELQLISQRLKRFKENVVPLLQELAHQNKLKVVDANRPKETLYEETRKVLSLQTNPVREMATSTQRI